MQKKTDSKTEKELAKTAMTAAIAIAVLTAPFLKRNRAMKNIHVSAGVLLAGFSLWHHMLYQPKKKKNGYSQLQIPRINGESSSRSGVSIQAPDE
jgi:predicted acyltransferase